MNINLSKLRTPSNFIKDCEGKKINGLTVTRKRLYELIGNKEIPFIDIDGRKFIQTDKIN